MASEKNTHKPSVLNIVILGAWNVRLFRPDWLIQTLELSGNEDFKGGFGVGLDFEQRDIKFEFCGIALMPTRNVLTIQIIDQSNIDKKLKFSVFVLRKIIANLCHTPLKQIGFNLVFEFDNSTKSELAKHLLKKEKYKDFHFHQRRINKKEKNFDINIIANLIPEETSNLGKINFNFQYNNALTKFTDNIFIEHLKYAEGEIK